MFYKGNGTNKAKVGNENNDESASSSLEHLRQRGGKCMILRTVQDGKRRVLALCSVDGANVND